MRATDPLRREHSELLPKVEWLRVTADQADMLQPDALAAEVERDLRFLREELVPHAHAEEAVLYPAVERSLGSSSATATMTGDHMEVLRLVAELEGLHEALLVGVDRGRVRDLQRVLYGLYAVLRLHFAKEEGIYLPILDESLSSADAVQLFAEMELAAHQATGRARGRPPPGPGPT